MLYRNPLSIGVSSGGSGGIPPGVGFQQIDGGATYYATNSFTFAAASRTYNGVTYTAGWDDPKFIPIGTWLSNIPDQATANRYLDLGLNSMWAVNSGIALSIVQANNICLVQLTGQPGSGESGGLAGTSTETVGMLTFDEPQNWAETIQGIGGAAATFTATMSGGVLNVSAVNAGSTVNNGILTRNVGIVGTGVNPSDFIFGYGAVGVGKVGPDYGVTGSDTVSTPETMSITYAGTPNTIQDHRFWWVNQTNAWLDQTPGTAPFTPTPNTVVSALTQLIATPSGTGQWVNRHIDMVSIDSYCVSVGSGWNSALTAANIYGIYNISSSSTSLTVQSSGTINFFLNQLPVNPKFVVGGKFQLLQGGSATNSMAIDITAINYTTGQVTGTIRAQPPASGVGNGPFNNFLPLYGLSPQQCNRPCHYGDQVDALRSLQAGNFPAPCFVFIENGDPASPSALDAGSHLMTPDELNASVWAIFIHGGRQIVWFNEDPTVGFPPMSGSPSGGSGDNFGNAFYQSGGNGMIAASISMYDRCKATHNCLYTLAPVINSQFAVANPQAYVQVSSAGGTGFTFPYSPTITAQNGFSKFNGDLSGTPGSNNGLFEVMAKYYNFATQMINGVTLTQGKFWLFCAYRGPGSDTNIPVTFTIGNSGATTVTRIYSDGVIGAASNGAGGTRIQVGSTAFMSTGDVAHIFGTSGTVTVGGSSLNATFTITVVDATHFDIPGAFAGALSSSTAGVPTTGFGTVITEHLINISGNVTFSDTFPFGNSIGIYRVN